MVKPTKAMNGLKHPITVSVTRFCEISPLWQKFTSCWQIFMVYFLFGKMLSLLWQICDIIGLIFILATGQILKNNQTILSHCKRVSTAPRRSAVMDKR